MKKAILFSIMALLLLFSCKKEHHTPNPTQTKYKINFTVSGFTQQIVGDVNNALKTRSLKTNAVTPLDSSISVLQYLVFDSNRKIVSEVRQQSGDAGFGTISDALAAGTYTVVFAGGDSGLSVTSTNLRSNDPSSELIPEIADSPKWGDTFFKRFTLTVTGGDITQNVSLNRIVGKLTVNLEDVLPANASLLIVTANTGYPFYPALDTLTVGINSQTSAIVNIPASAIGKTNYQVTQFFVVNGTAQATVTINCYDSNRNLIGQSIVNNVTLSTNTQTVLSGLLFGSGGAANVGIGTWDPSAILIHF